MLRLGDFAPPFQLTPVFGVSVTSEGQSRPIVLVFLRGLSPRRLAPLVELWPDLDREGVGLVVLTDVPLAKARDAIPRQLLRFPVVLDNPFPETPSRSGSAVVLSASREVIYRGPISGLRSREWSSP